MECRITSDTTMVGHRLLLVPVQSENKLIGAPEFPYEPRELPGYFRPAALTFEAPDIHYPLDDHHKWASIVPPLRGFVRLGAEGTPFSISLFHQLHCVNGVRFSYVAARDGLFKTEKARAEAFGHVNHCFDVIRQSILCKADTTLVPVGARNTTAPVTRRCRDWSQVREFVDDNHEFWRDIPFHHAPPPTTTNQTWEEGTFVSARRPS
jgi:hypothetical protein